MTSEIARYIPNFNKKWFCDNVAKHVFLSTFEISVLNENHLSDGHVRFIFNSEMTDDLFYTFGIFIAKHDPFYSLKYIVGGNLKISELLDEKYRFEHFYTIDITKHLRREISLNKTEFMNPDGRIHTTEYSYNDIIVARTRHVYRHTPGTTVLFRKAEILNYSIKSGFDEISWTEDVLIMDKTYQFLNMSDLCEVIKEREDAREKILSYCSGICLGVLLAANPTMTPDEVSAMVSPFLVEINQMRQSFISVGDSGLSNYIFAIDLLTTPHAWLSVEIQAGVTLKDFILSSIIYTTQETHLDIILT